MLGLRVVSVRTEDPLEDPLEKTAYSEDSQADGVDDRQAGQKELGVDDRRVGQKELGVDDRRAGQDPELGK